MKINTLAFCLVKVGIFAAKKHLASQAEKAMFCLIEKKNQHDLYYSL